MESTFLTPEVITGIIALATSAITGLGTFIATRRSERATRRKEAEEERIASEERALAEKVTTDMRSAQVAEQSSDNFEKLIQANQKFRDEIRIELDDAKKEIEDLKKKLDLKDTEIEELKNSIADLKQELSLKEKKLADMKIEIMRRNIKVDDLRGRVDLIDQRDAERLAQQNNLESSNKPDQ